MRLPGQTPQVLVDQVGTGAPFDHLLNHLWADFRTHVAIPNVLLFNTTVLLYTIGRPQTISKLPSQPTLKNAASRDHAGEIASDDLIDEEDGF